MHDLLAYFAVTAALPPWDPTSSSMLHSRLHATGTAPDPSLGFYKEATIEVDVDHFGFEPLPPFRLRYFYNDTFWDRKSAGPIFLYTGNEAPITEFIKNTGALLEYAPTFKALVVRQICPFGIRAMRFIEPGPTRATLPEWMAPFCC